MTHFLDLREASQPKSEPDIAEPQTRVCVPCGRKFRPGRTWQKQCSPRCRQRAYVERKNLNAMGYYGA